MFAKNGLFEAILRQIREHEESFETDNPRDFLGTLIGSLKIHKI